jgi:hypothetical protein
MWRSSEADSQVWFYDESKKQLYAASIELIPPDKGIGGPANDGVRAVVVGYGGEKPSSANRRIAYLQTYAPELKALLERVQAARHAGNPVQESLPSRDSDFFVTNTLVRLPDEPTWHPSNTPDAQRVMSAWRSWTGSAGELPVPVTP